MRSGFALHLAALVPLVWAGAASGQPLSVSGTAGFLSEWQFSGSVTETAVADEFTGSLALKHVGLCTHDGPDERVSDIRLRLTDPNGLARSRSTKGSAKAVSEIKATFVLEGAPCTLSGRFSGTYTGSMECAGAQRVPVTLSVN